MSSRPPITPESMRDFSPVWQPLYILHQQLVLHTQKAGLITVSLACQDFTGRTSPYIHWNKPRAQHGHKNPRKVWFHKFCRSHSSLWGGREMWTGEKGLNILHLENPSKWHVKQILCSAELPGKWLSQHLSRLISGAVSFQRAHSAAQSAHQAVPYLSPNPSPPHSGRADKWRQVCCIQHVNWASAPQICFFSSAFYLVFNTKQPPLITSRLKTLSD